MIANAANAWWTASNTLLPCGSAVLVTHAALPCGVLQCCQKGASTTLGLTYIHHALYPHSSLSCAIPDGVKSALMFGAAPDRLCTRPRGMAIVSPAVWVAWAVGGIVAAVQFVLISKRIYFSVLVLLWGVSGTWSARGPTPNTQAFTSISHSHNRLMPTCICGTRPSRFCLPAGV
jgi:hypothetical protein